VAVRLACCCYWLTLDSDALQPAIFISHLQLRGAFFSSSSKKARARASSTHRPNHSLNKLRVFPPAFTCLFANYCTGRCKHLICQFSRLAAAALPLIKLHQAQAASGVKTKRRVATTSVCIAHAGARALTCGWRECRRRRPCLQRLRAYTVRQQRGTGTVLLSKDAVWFRVRQRGGAAHWRTGTLAQGVG
jgi:hypothetical protein